MGLQVLFMCWGMFVPLFQQVTEHVRFSLLFLPCLLLVVIPTSIQVWEPLLCSLGLSHVRDTECSVWDMSRAPSCRPVLRAFGVLLRVRSVRAQLRGKHGTSSTVSWYHFLELLSFHDFPQGNLSCSQAPPSCPLTRQPRLQFPGSVRRFLNLCLLLGPTSERSERKSHRDSSSSRAPGSLVPPVREKGSLPSEFEAFAQLLLPLCHCSIAQGLGQEREGKKTEDFSQSF